MVEHGIADPMVAGSIPVTPFSNNKLLVSLDGQDTRFSPWRPGFDSRTRNVFLAKVCKYASIITLEAMAQLVARRIPDPKVGGSNPSSFNTIMPMYTHTSINQLYLLTRELGLVGYDNCLTRNGSRVRFSELVSLV